MASVNKVTLLGNCGRDPEVRYLPSGQAVANISLATSSKRKNKDTGEVTEDTQWHRITFYDRLAEIVGEYVRVGSSIYIEGRIKYGKYTDKDGVEKNTCDIVAHEMQLLGGRPDGGQQGGGQGSNQRQAPAQGQQRQQGNNSNQGNTQGQQRQQPAQPGNRQAPPQGQQRPQSQGNQQNNQAPRGGAGSGFEDMDDDIPF